VIDPDYYLQESRSDNYETVMDFRHRNRTSPFATENPSQNPGDIVIPVQQLDDFNLALLSNSVMGWVLNDRRWCQ
jgi:hypothetical protein